MVEVQISLPKSINDIKLGDYQRYMKVYEANKEVDDANFLELKLLESFCEIDLLTLQIKCPLRHLTLPYNICLMCLSRRHPLQGDLR
jgi:hypothetical protein